MFFQQQVILITNHRKCAKNIRIQRKSKSKYINLLKMSQSTIFVLLPRIYWVVIVDQVFFFDFFRWKTMMIFSCFVDKEVSHVLRHKVSVCSVWNLFKGRRVFKVVLLGVPLDSIDWIVSGFYCRYKLLSIFIVIN